jgi:hypothetical protein
MRLNNSVDPEMFALGIKLSVWWFTIAPFPSERKVSLKKNYPVSVKSLLATIIWSQALCGPLLTIHSNSPEFVISSVRTIHSTVTGGGAVS